MSKTVFKHHQETIDRVAGVFRDVDEVRALVVGGSIAHGFATESSDVDIFLVVNDEDYETRLRERQLTYWNNELTAYEGGYVDGKYISAGFLKGVAQRGSEPARFAFKDAFVVFSHIENLDALIVEASRYPIEDKDNRIEKFYAQLEAWKWFICEAKKHDNPYLLSQAVSNFTLFSGRLILAYNEELYPYHKWFLRVLDKVEEKPRGLVEQIELVLRDRDDDDIDQLYKMVTEFTDWGCNKYEWASRFMVDCELTWMNGTTPVADL